MATFAQFVHVILSIFLVLSLCSDAFIDTDADTNVETVQGRWCIANPQISKEKLNEVIGTLCSKVDCSPIKEGGSCFLPNDPYNHASFAVNLYYQHNDRAPEICEAYFGLVTDQDPSKDNCHYP
ncbi:hypothetical protein ACOSP7_008696 [Xanthoceras sorbifolium]